MILTLKKLILYIEVECRICTLKNKKELNKIIFKQNCLKNKKELN